MAPAQLAIHDNLTEAVLHLEKAKDLIRMQAAYTCQAVDVNAVEAACRMLENLCGLLKDVDQSALEHSAAADSVTKV